MNTPSIVFYIGLGFTLFFELLLIAARSALRNSLLVRLLQFRDQHQVEIDAALALLNSPGRASAAMYFLQSLARFLLFGGIFALVSQQFSVWSGWLSVIIVLLAGFVISLVEWMVERGISRNPEKWLVRMTAFIRVVSVIFAPFASLMLLFSFDKLDDEDGQSKVTEDELRTLVDVSEQDGLIEQEERQMIHSIFQLGDTLTREIMVPRIDVVAIEVDTPLSEAMDKLLETGFSRVPVFDDTVDNVIGMLYAKDLISLWRAGKNQDESLRSILREPYFVPEAKKVDELLADLQGRRVHMAIVVDEYGGVAGVVTLEDIIEEIFGEIQDEYDENEEQLYQVMEDGSYLLRGRIDLDDFNDLMDADLPVDEADTLGGFLYMRFGHVPSVGERVDEDGLRLTVEQVSSRRIRKVRAQYITAEQEDETYA